MTGKKTSNRTAFVFQGGGALGSYQAGACERLDEAGIRPDIVAGISIGAINSALIAGNPPERRIERLKTFWNRVTSATDWPAFAPVGQVAAGLTMMAGAPGFFTPRFPNAAFAPPGDPAKASHYDTSPLRDTLNELVDFDLLNDGPVRLTVGAVNVTTGELTWFDTAERRVEAEHIMASGALPPGFAAVEIDGEYYWDGGLVSNTPLARIVTTREDMTPLTIWQVDLFSMKGDAPKTVWETEARDKDLRYASRTKFVMNFLREEHELAQALHDNRAALPEALKKVPIVKRLLHDPARAPLTLINLIYRAADSESGVKDYEFSRGTMKAHWATGRHDVEENLAHPEFTTLEPETPGMCVIDLSGSDHRKDN